MDVDVFWIHREFLCQFIELCKETREGQRNVADWLVQVWDITRDGQIDWLVSSFPIQRHKFDRVTIQNLLSFLLSHSNFIRKMFTKVKIVVEKKRITLLILTVCIKKILHLY